MESLTKQVENISISNTAPVVGVFYHPDMLLHKPLKHHPENPGRLTSILEHLTKQDLISKCKVYDDFDIIPKDILIDFHGENYVEYVETLWDDTLNREIRFYKDTYYNKHTVRAANLAANGIKLAVDEVMEGKINRAYGIVRPPGHHAAAEHDRIAGFCIYNNVAVAAKYAVKKYGMKRIVIFDWDVHHGDSTSKFFYDDAEILYISIHRYDKGVFYPGPFGDPKNIGKDAGKGYNLNLGWNLPHPYVTVGDDEYIYVLERVFIPIIKEFDPELIFISAGFDSARGDPLGGLDLTPDGYAYMTKRLLDLAPNRTIVALEGGYNLDSIAISSEACLRILLGEEMPLKNNENEETYAEMRELCNPNEIGFEAAKEVIEIYKEFWPVLTQDEKLVEWEEHCKKNAGVNVVEIAAGHREHVIIKQDKFLKKLKDTEVQFYRDLKDVAAGETGKIEFVEETKLVNELTSKCLDIATIGGKEFAVLENLCWMHPKASVIDFKVGRVTYCPYHSEDVKKYHADKSEKTLSGKLGFRISGLLLKDKKGKIVKRAHRKEIYYDVNEGNIGEYIKNFLCTNEAGVVNKEALEHYVGFLKRIIEFFETKNSRGWIGTSVLFVLDNTTNYYKASWIDVGKYIVLEEGKKDENVLEGLRNLLKLFSELLV